VFIYEELKKTSFSTISLWLSLKAIRGDMSKFAEKLLFKPFVAISVIYLLYLNVSKEWRNIKVYPHFDSTA